MHSGAAALDSGRSQKTRGLRERSSRGPANLATEPIMDSPKGASVRDKARVTPQAGWLIIPSSVAIDHPEGERERFGTGSAHSGSKPNLHCPETLVLGGKRG